MCVCIYIYIYIYIHIIISYQEGPAACPGSGSPAAARCWGGRLRGPLYMYNIYIYIYIYPCLYVLYMYNITYYDIPWCNIHTCHPLPPSEIDLGLRLAVFTSSEGQYLFHRIGWKGRIWQLCLFIRCWGRAGEGQGKGRGRAGVLYYYLYHHYYHYYYYYHYVCCLYFIVMSYVCISCHQSCFV